VAIPFKKAPPKIFIILDSNEDTTTKSHALEDQLTAVQQTNPIVNFMLWQATYTDIRKHQFHFVPHTKHMMQGFTPFCLQKMDQTNKIMLCLLEEKMCSTTYTTMNDRTTRNKNLKCAPITNALGFLTTIANTYALAQVLFMHTSLLTIGLQGLLTIMMHGHHNGKLSTIGQYHRDWYAHIL